tara:strand:- start:174877 stop:175053 length:177 start_codon:yes stop_codon:yes gene_type:complete
MLSLKLFFSGNIIILALIAAILGWGYYSQGSVLFAVIHLGLFACLIYMLIKLFKLKDK